MLLDLPTLFIVATCVTALLGLFLVMLWIQDRSVRALGWWAMAYLLGGFAVMLWLLQPTLHENWSQELASALLFLACGMIWSGARMFHGRPTLGLTTAAGAILWLVVTRIPGIASSGELRVIISSIVITVYVTMTAIELKNERRRDAVSRRHVIPVAVLHGAVFLSPIAAQHAFPRATQGFGEGFFALFALLTLLYVVGTAFIVVVMAKEHALNLHRTAAMTDPLTGLFNRRGFFDRAQKLLERRARREQAVAMLMFDLDHFKKINDRFGHDVGDAALRVFAATVGQSMRSEDIVGRLGGEEFVAILPNGIDAAITVAERMRLAFQAAGIEIGGHDVNATVSVGAAELMAGEDRVEQLLARADAALYRAKSGGRNRVLADRGAPAPTADESAPQIAPVPVTRQADRNEPAPGAPELIPAGI